MEQNPQSDPAPSPPPVPPSPPPDPGPAPDEEQVLAEIGLLKTQINAVEDMLRHIAQLLRDTQARPASAAAEARREHERLLTAILELERLLRTMPGALQQHLEGRLGGLGERLGGVGERIYALDGKVTALDGRLGGLDGHFAALRGKLTGIAHLRDEVRELRGGLTALPQTTLERVAPGLKELGTRLDGVDKALGDKLIGIDHALDRVEKALGDKLSGVVGALGGLDKALGDVERRLGDKLGEIDKTLGGTLNATRQAVADKLGDVPTRLDKIEEALGGQLDATRNAVADKLGGLAQNASIEHLSAEIKALETSFSLKGKPIHLIVLICALFVLVICGAALDACGLNMWRQFRQEEQKLIQQIGEMQQSLKNEQTVAAQARQEVAASHKALDETLKLLQGKLEQLKPRPPLACPACKQPAVQINNGPYPPPATAPAR